MISNKTDFLVSAARNNAMNSPCLHKHGCVISVNGKIVANGFNNYNTFSNNIFGDNVCSCHAEVDALRSFYRRNKRSYEKEVKESDNMCG